MSGPEALRVVSPHRLIQHQFQVDPPHGGIIESLRLILRVFAVCARCDG